MKDHEIAAIDRLALMMVRQGKEKSRALPQSAYGDPAKTVKFEREKGDQVEKIKELMREWATWQIEKVQGGYPSMAAFAIERVDSSNRSTETYLDRAPDDVVRLNKEIETLAPMFKRIIALEYLDPRPQKTKAAVVGIPRQVFSQRVLWIHEQLRFRMFGA